MARKPYHAPASLNKSQCKYYIIIIYNGNQNRCNNECDNNNSKYFSPAKPAYQFAFNKSTYNISCYKHRSARLNKRCRQIKGFCKFVNRYRPRCQRHIHYCKHKRTSNQSRIFTFYRTIFHILPPCSFVKFSFIKQLLLLQLYGFLCILSIFLSHNCN